MASVKRVGSKKTSRAKAEFEDELNLTESEGKASKKSAKRSLDFLAERDAVEKQVELAGDTVWIHNISGTEFHVPPISNKTDDAETAVVFQVNEVLPFEKNEIENKRFKKCLMDRKIRIVSEDDVREIQKAAEKAKHRSGKAKVGLHESGLPMNKRAALNYIFDCEDIDELEGYNDLEDREFIQEAIEERIEELEGGEWED